MEEQTPQPGSKEKKKAPKKKEEKQEETDNAGTEKMKKLLQNWSSKEKKVNTDNTVTRSNKRKTVEQVDDKAVTVSFKENDRKKPVDVGIVDRKPSRMFDQAMQRFSRAGSVEKDDSFESWKRKRAEKRKKVEDSDLAVEDQPKKRKIPPGVVRKNSSENNFLKSNAIFNHISCSSVAGEQGHVHGAGADGLQGGHGQEHIAGHELCATQLSARKTRQRAGQG